MESMYVGADTAITIRSSSTPLSLSFLSYLLLSCSVIIMIITSVFFVQEHTVNVRISEGVIS